MKRAFILTLVLAMACMVHAQAKNGIQPTSGIKPGMETQTPKKGQQKIQNHSISMQKGDAVSDKQGAKTDKPVVIKNTKQGKSDVVDEKSDMSSRIIFGVVPQLPSKKDLVSDIVKKSNNKSEIPVVEVPSVALFRKRLGEVEQLEYVAMMKEYPSAGMYSFDKVLLDRLGIEPEAYQNMSPKERMEINEKYADQLSEFYLRTLEQLSADEEYNTLLKQYEACSEKIESAYRNVDEACNKEWKEKYARKKKLAPADLEAYYNTAVSLVYDAVVSAMDRRKKEQLDLAEQLDSYLQERFSGTDEAFFGFFNYSAHCAVQYVADAGRVLAISDPRKR